MFSVCVGSGFLLGRNQFTGSWPALIFNEKEYNRKYQSTSYSIQVSEWVNKYIYVWMYICMNIQGQNVKWNSNKNTEYHCYVFFFLGDDRLLLPQKSIIQTCIHLRYISFHNILSTWTPIIFLSLSVKNLLLLWPQNFLFLNTD